MIVLLIMYNEIYVSLLCKSLSAPCARRTPEDIQGGLSIDNDILQRGEYGLLAVRLTLSANQHLVINVHLRHWLNDLESTMNRAGNHCIAIRTWCLNSTLTVQYARFLLMQSQMLYVHLDKTLHKAQDFYLNLAISLRFASAFSGFLVTPTVTLKSHFRNCVIRTSRIPFIHVY